LGAGSATEGHLRASTMGSAGGELGEKAHRRKNSTARGETRPAVTARGGPAVPLDRFGGRAIDILEQGIACRTRFVVEIEVFLVARGARLAGLVGQAEGLPRMKEREKKIHQGAAAGSRSPDSRQHLDDRGRRRDGKMPPSDFHSAGSTDWPQGRAIWTDSTLEIGHTLSSAKTRSAQILFKREGLETFLSGWDGPCNVSCIVSSGIRASPVETGNRGVGPRRLRNHLCGMKHTTGGTGDGKGKLNN